MLVLVIIRIVGAFALCLSSAGSAACLDTLFLVHFILCPLATVVLFACAAQTRIVAAVRYLSLRAEPLIFHGHVHGHSPGHSTSLLAALGLAGFRLTVSCVCAACGAPGASKFEWSFHKAWQGFGLVGYLVEHALLVTLIRVLKMRPPRLQNIPTLPS